MIATLHIENIAVIEQADIEFEAGLNLLTGETGAGKSIIIDSLSAVLGMRTSRDLIRTGCDSAKVSAVFYGTDKAVERFLSDNGCTAGEELLISRELRNDGRNVCRLNGSPVTAALLKELGVLLVNIHGQHDNQLLMREDSHIHMLDSFGGISKDAYVRAYDKWRMLEKERKSLQTDEDEKIIRTELLQERLQEWEELALEEGEEDNLAARRTVLRDAGRICSALESAYAALYGDEDTMGAADLTANAARALDGISAQGEVYQNLAERLTELQYALSDCASESRSLWEDMEDSERELEALETRLDKIRKLCRRLNVKADALPAMAVAWEAELSKLQNGEERLRELETEVLEAYDDLCAKGVKLGEKRQKAARQLEERMTKELQDLDMKKVRFAVLSEACTPTADGMETLRFLISVNLGEDLKPLSKVASGGELSRIMLALKNLLSDGEEGRTMVFDEVDSGVSGQAAWRVAEKLSSAARQKQVLCITHLPQIAAMADSHFLIEKGESGGRTVTKVNKLSREQRMAEIARINAGLTITDTTLRGAEEMLAQADAMKQKRASGTANP